MGKLRPHLRIKPKAGAAPNAEERRHHARIHGMPCIGCGAQPVSVHHVVSDGYQRITRSHRRVVPVCPDCHQDGPRAIHKIGHGAWNEEHGLDQLAIADRLWREGNGR